MGHSGGGGNALTKYIIPGVEAAGGAASEFFAPGNPIGMGLMGSGIGQLAGGAAGGQTGQSIGGTLGGLGGGFAGGMGLGSSLFGGGVPAGSVAQPGGAGLAANTLAAGSPGAFPAPAAPGSAASMAGLSRDLASAYLQGQGGDPLSMPLNQIPGATQTAAGASPAAAPAAAGAGGQPANQQGLMAYLQQMGGPGQALAIAQQLMGGKGQGQQAQTPKPPAPTTRPGGGGGAAPPLNIQPAVTNVPARASFTGGAPGMMTLPYGSNMAQQLQSLRMLQGLG